MHVNAIRKFFMGSGSTSIGSGIIAIAGLPVGYNFGLDMRMWQIGDKFTGVRDVPPGIHYVYYSTPDDETRQGFFITVTRDSPMVVRVWDPRVESLVPVDDDATFATIQRSYLNDFYYISGLAPFATCMDESAQKEWKQAISFVNPSIIDRVQPVSNQDFRSQQQSGGEAASSETRTIFFTDISRSRPGGTATSGDVTLFHLDRTKQLESALLEKKIDSDLELIGELQAAFILFLLGQNYDAFVQWRKLMELFLGCRERGILAHADKFAALAKALQFQVNQMPEDFLFDAGISDDDVSHRKHEKNVFILPLLSQFVITCSDDILVNEMALQREVQELDKLMSEKYGEEWTSVFNPEELDDPPVIVHLS
jgi:A1 cistron-splicing factor AAR2